MIEDQFQYSVLKYRHSFLLNEVVNVGLLFLFPSNKLNFIYPKKLNRISELYYNIELGTIKTFQSLFEDRCVELNNRTNNIVNSLFSQYEPFPLFEDLISSEFIGETASALYFDKIKTGIYADEDSIVKYYYNEYFSYYDQRIMPYKRDEKYIEHAFRSSLKKKLSDVYRIEINKTISVGLITERFKWGWKNGTNNLITPIGFDLESDSIKHKALSWYGKFSFLKDYAVENNISFDVLTTQPSEEGLKAEYNKALKVIKASNAPINIYDETKIEDYSTYVANHLKE